MTEPTAPTGKVAQLTPEEWKTLVCLNAQQLVQYLQGIPSATEGGAPGLTDQHMALVDGHLARGRTFMRAWSLAKVAGAPAQPQGEQAAATAQTGNGATEPVKRKGGWQKGRKRKPAAPEAAQS